MTNHEQDSILELLLRELTLRKPEGLRRTLQILLNTARKLEVQEAMLALYTAALYAALEQEETKLWQYSTEALYSLGDRALVQYLNRYIMTRQENAQT
jgi:hypothetical protein